MRKNQENTSPSEPQTPTKENHSDYWTPEKIREADERAERGIQALIEAIGEENRKANLPGS